MDILRYIVLLIIPCIYKIVVRIYLGIVLMLEIRKKTKDRIKIIIMKHFL